MGQRRLALRLVALPLLLSVSACQITWREPVIEPLNTNRFFDSALDQTCEAAEQVVQQIGLSIEDVQREDNACLLETDFKVFSDEGENPMDHLARVAMVGVGGFIGGRYTLTVTTRDVRNAGTRVRVTSRIEGYVNEEFGYQVLRSNGLIETAVFDHIGTRLGEPAQQAR
ncbi:MAG: hypothetical protein GKS06_18610 [Acidobacteria bacterium]|nr:hypothetical protein [Acidobacteriota bacterium]